MLISYRDPANQFTELDLPHEGGVIGYDEGNFIILDEIGVSALHLRLSAVNHHLFAEDLKSLNGSYLNRTLLTEKTEINDGDAILVGMVLLRFKKYSHSWSVTAIRQDRSRFVVDKAEVSGKLDTEDDNATAVTVIASTDVKEIISSRDFSKLSRDSFQKLPPLNPGNVSLDMLQGLGKYRMIRKIASGGMGVVFLAKHKVMNSYRALKVLPDSMRQNKNNCFERFIREARIASEIRHPNIVGVMDVEIDPMKAVSYIVMEFIDGGTLRHILKAQQTLPEIQALFIVREIAEALNVIEKHKIVHRDIKPDNIMFTRSGEVKLADLGIAKTADEDVNLTKTNMMLGTPAYLSPEQIEACKDVDIRSDIYSLGATLYEMLTGSAPYAGKNLYDIFQKMISETIVDPRKKNPHVSPATARIVMKMLHKNPARRYQTPQELLEALDAVLPRYSASVVQEIVRAAVLGTGLPDGVKATVSSGMSATFDKILRIFKFSAGR